MQCILMNFDDRTRIIHDVERMPIVINIGSIVQCDVDDSTMELLKRAMDMNDPLVIVPSIASQSPEVLSLMALLQDLDTGDYDEILARCTLLLGADNVGGPRPSRHELRYKLRAIALGLAYGAVEANAAAIQSSAAQVEKKKQVDEEHRRQVQDDVDPDRLDEDLRKQREADRRRVQDQAGSPPSAGTHPPMTLRDQMDEALGIAVGGDAADLASALSQPPKGDDPDAFDPAKARRLARPSIAKGAKGAKKAASKRTAVSAKRSTATKKPVGRVRA